MSKYYNPDLHHLIEIPAEANCDKYECFKDCPVFTAFSKKDYNRCCEYFHAEPAEATGLLGYVEVSDDWSIGDPLPSEIEAQAKQQSIAEYMLQICNSRASDSERSADARMAYKSCVSMLEYALAGNWECLRQFDDAESSGPSYYEMDATKRVIVDYYMRSFSEAGNNFSDPCNIPLGYTTSEDGWHEIQISCNLEQCELYIRLDNEIIRTDSYDTLYEFRECCLKNLDFDELVSIAEDQLKIDQNDKYDRDEEFSL